MYIKTTYDQDFDDLYMHLKSKYPQRLFDADGIGKQTDMSAFSKNFFASSVTADASIDANANVDDVSVIAYETEINKPHLKLNSYYILWKELKRLYGLETANNVIEHQLTGDIYIHDAHGIGSGKPYSYYGGCCIIVKIDDVIKFLTFEEFYNLMAETLPIIDAGNDTFEIKTPNVLILDEGNVWTPVYKVLKHKSHTNMVRIGTSCGKDTLVTSDHPVITEKKVRPASDVSGRDVLKNWDITYDFIEESRDNTKLHSTFEYTTPDLAKNVIPQNILFVNKDVVRQYLAFVFDTFGRYTDAGAVIIDTLGYGDLHKIAELVRMMGSGLAEINISDHPKRKPYKLTCRITDKMIITYSTTCRKAAQKGNTNGRKSNWGKNGAKVTRKFEMDAPEYVYDITTASGQFYCQGLIQHNCFNYSTYDIMLNGLPMVKKIKSVPPKYLYSFKSQLEQFVVIASNSTLGATGLADLLVVMSYYVKNILKTKSDAHFHFRDEKDCWAYIKENLVSFIYTINQPMRANQSPFTNTSIYDANFLNKLCDDYIFPDGSSPDREIVQKLQDLYLTVMNEELERTPVTFPVTTGCFSIDENNNILDEEFLGFIARHVQKWGFINIYAGASSTLSSCCFDKNQGITVRINGKVIQGAIGDIINNLDDSCNNVEVFYGKWQKAKPIKVAYSDLLYQITLKSGDVITTTKDHINPTNTGDKLSAELTTNDFLLTNTGYKQIHTITTFKNTNKYVYCFEVEDKTKPYFILDNGVITHNCRLRSEQKSEYFNSFGSGSSKIGSLGVCSINLPRIAIKSNGDENKFFEMLAYFVGVAAKVNNAKRHIIQKRINNGNEPLYTLGFMDISKQYSTFGVNGFHEMLQVLGYDILTDEGSDFGVKVIKFINNENKKYEKQYNAPHNTEQVPAENMSIKMVEKDRIMGYDLGCDLYSNQFIPLITNADMLDRIRLQGKFDKHFSGGAICHLNVDTRIDDIEQIKSLIRICVKMGVVYFAINYVLQQCEDGHMTVGNREICPICGKNIENTYTRPVGFLTNVKNWHVVRREKDFPNRQFYNNINIGDVNN